MWFILVYAFTKWSEVFQMSTSTSANKTMLRTIFGIPNQMVTDSGSQLQFTATEFEEFCTNNGVNHTLTAPNHTSSNKEADAERSEVQ